MTRPRPKKYLVRVAPGTPNEAHEWVEAKEKILKNALIPNLNKTLKPVEKPKETSAFEKFLKDAPTLI